MPNKYFGNPSISTHAWQWTRLVALDSEDSGEDSGLSTSLHQGYTWLVLHIHLVHLKKKSNTIVTMVHLLIHRNLLYSESSSWLRWWNTEEMNQQGTSQRICKKLLGDYGTCIARDIIRRLKNWCIMCHWCTTWKTIITIVIDFSRSGCPARNQPRCTADTSALLK